MSLVDKAREQARLAAEKAATYAAAHKDKVVDGLEKVEGIADRKTGGKYHDKIVQAGEKAGSYVEKLSAPKDPEQPA